MIDETPEFYEFGDDGSAKVYSDKTCNIAHGKNGHGSGRGVIISQTSLDRIKADKDKSGEIISELLEGDHYRSGGDIYLAAMINSKPVIAGPLKDPDAQEKRNADSQLLDCVKDETGKELPDSNSNLAALANAVKSGSKIRHSVSRLKR